MKCSLPSFFFWCLYALQYHYKKLKRCPAQSFLTLSGHRGPDISQKKTAGGVPAVDMNKK